MENYRSEKWAQRSCGILINVGEALKVEVWDGMKSSKKSEIQVSLLLVRRTISPGVTYKIGAITKATTWHQTQKIRSQALRYECMEPVRRSNRFPKDHSGVRGGGAPKARKNLECFR